MKNLLNLILILGLAFMLTGCPPKETTPPEAEETTPVSVEEKKSTMTLDDLEDEGEISEEQRLEDLSLIHISAHTRRYAISYDVFC